MKYPEWNSSRFVLLFSLFLLVLFQANCAQTPAEQGRQALEEAAQAMGGLEARHEVEFRESWLRNPEALTGSVTTRSSTTLLLEKPLPR